MSNLTDQVRKLPHSPGVYIYRDKANTVIYVGKAVDLARRVRQYFQCDDAVGPKTEKLVSQIVTLETIETAGEFDALLLEAKLIRKHQPKYNVVAKDDKSPLYIAMTLHEELPRIVFARKPSRSQSDTKDRTLYIGPFQSARVTKMLLRSLRRVVPYCTERRRTGKPCFYTHLGLCNPCPSEIVGLEDGEKKTALTHRYRLQMFRLRDIFLGKSRTVVMGMEREMQKLADSGDFEHAILLRRQVQALTGIMNKRYDPNIYLMGTNAVDDIVSDELSGLTNMLKPFYPEMARLARIECYDISNTFGEYATGSMVVLSEGRVDTGEYRRFRIRRKSVPNDVAMMEEVLTRRFRHADWPRPDLLVVDGGKAQVHRAKETLTRFGIPVPVIGLAKRNEEVVVPSAGSFKIVRVSLTNPAIHLLQRIRDEAHRFALTYHRLLRKTGFGLV